MQEVLFRGKRTDNGEWVKGLPCSFNANNNVEGIGTYDGERHKVDPDTVCLYTGLTDKNSKKIFDGDIIRFDEEEFVVFWNCEDSQWQARSTQLKENEITCDTGNPLPQWFDFANTFYFDSIDVETAEIIGNVYDNPELIEGD